jgi:FHA domain
MAITERHMCGGRQLMTDQGEAVRRPPRAPMPKRARRRWAVAAGVAGCWAILLAITGSMLAATALLLFLVALTAGSVAGLRAMGINAEHPWVQQLRTRPWRDGQEVLQLALRRLPEVFVITPSGSLLAPNSVELRLHPRDYGSLCELMDMSLVDASATEVYQEQVTARGARLARPGAAGVHVIADLSVPPGRYLLRQARPLPPVPALQPEPVGPERQRGYQLGAGNWPFAKDGYTRGEAAGGAGVTTGLPTVAERERSVPPLRLVTGDRVVETRTPGARAGRGDVELVLPGMSTISREHARFTYSDGEWWVTNLGRNGLLLNGAALAGPQVVRDGDSIKWGSNAAALVSRVEIG